MEYIITENQDKLLTEQDNNILRIPFAAFGYDWNDLQLFLERRGNPLYEITDDLKLSYSEIKSLGNLTSVGGDLDLGGSKIKTLGNLTSVGGDLDLLGTDIKSLENLTSVGGNMYVGGSKIKTLGNLTSVGGKVYL